MGACPQEMESPTSQIATTKSENSSRATAQRRLPESTGPTPWLVKGGLLRLLRFGFITSELEMKMDRRYWPGTEAGNLHFGRSIHARSPEHQLRTHNYT